MPDYRDDGRFIKEDGELQKPKSDPHCPRNLLRRQRDKSGDGFNQKKEGWEPTPWNKTSGAGKGDRPRKTALSAEEYGYKYDLATGRITKKEFEKLMKEYNS